MIKNYFCKKCNKETQFNGTNCKECKRIYDQDYRKQNKEKIAIIKKKWYDENKNIESFKEKQFCYRQKNAGKIKIRSKNYTLCVDKEKIRIYDKEYRRKNKISIRSRARIYLQRRRLYDKAFVMRQTVSCLIRYYLKKNGGSKNNCSVWEVLSYTPQELKEHLEKQFESWMTWENHRCL